MTMGAVVALMAGISSGRASGGGHGAKAMLVGGDGGIWSGIGSSFMSSLTGVGSMSMSCSATMLKSSAVRVKGVDSSGASAAGNSDSSTVTLRLCVGRLDAGHVAAGFASLGGNSVMGDSTRSKSTLALESILQSFSVISLTKSSIGCTSLLFMMSLRAWASSKV